MRLVGDIFLALLHIDREDFVHGDLCGNVAPLALVVADILGLALLVRNARHDEARSELLFYAGERRCVVEDNEADKNKRIDKVLERREVAGELALELEVDYRDERGGDYRTVDACHAAEDDHDEDFDRVVIREHRILDGRDVMRIDNACDAREECRENKHKELVESHVYAHCLCRYLVVAYSGYRSAVLRANKVVYHEQDDEHDDKSDNIERGIVPRIVLYRVRAKTHCLAENIEVLEYCSDYLAESEGHYREVVAFESECRKSDDETEYCGYHAAGEHADDEHQKLAADNIRELNGYVSAEICADAHKACVTERQLAEETDDEVQGNGEDDAVSYLDEQGRRRALEVAGQLENDRHAEDGDDHYIADVIFELEFAFCLCFTHQLHLLSSLLAEQTDGSYKKDQNQKTEFNGSGIGCEDGDGKAYLLDNAEEHAADHRAGDGADAADNRCGERLDAGHRAEGRLRSRYLEEIEHARERGESRADCKGDGNYLVDIYTHELSRAPVFGDGKHGASGPGLFDEQGQGNHYNRAYAHGEDRADADIGARNVHRAERGQRHALRLCAEDELRDTLKQVADADSGYQNRDGGNASQGSVGNLFDNNTHQRADYNRCQNADSEISARRQRCENGICADHDDIAVGKVEHLRDAVNHRVAQCYEGVDGAEAESVKYNTHNKPNAPLEWEKLELPKEKQKTAGEYTSPAVQKPININFRN